MQPARCDGCRRGGGGGRPQEGSDSDSESSTVELETCEDCGWSVCDSCAVNESRGPCRCLNSDMGNAYADMDGPKWYMGANGGARYTGPFKPAAQREMEATMMMDRISGGARLTECCLHTCRKPLTAAESKLCTRCRSVIYCSAECQRAAWSTPHGVHGTHKEQCGEYLPPERWPYISRDFLAYHEHWGRYPTAKPTVAQREADARLAQEAQRQRSEGELEDQRVRESYLSERDAMLQELGLPAADAPGEREADAAARAALMLGGGGPAPMDTGGGGGGGGGGGDDDVPMMSQAEATARARQILEETRRRVGRSGPAADE